MNYGFIIYTNNVCYRSGWSITLEEDLLARDTGFTFPQPTVVTCAKFRTSRNLSINTTGATGSSNQNQVLHTRTSYLQQQRHAAPRAALANFGSRPSTPMCVYQPMKAVSESHRSCDFTAHMCTRMILSNYKLFVNPLFKTNWFCTYLLMDLNTVENYVRSNHTRI